MTNAQLTAELSKLSPIEIAQLVAKVASDNYKAAKKETNRKYRELEKIEDEDEYERFEAEIDEDRTQSQWEELKDTAKSYLTDNR